MMLCDSCYDQVIAEHLTDQKNFVAEPRGPLRHDLPRLHRHQSSACRRHAGEFRVDPGTCNADLYLHSFPLKYMQVDSPDFTFQVFSSGICPSPRISTTKSTNPEIGSFSM